MRMLDAGLFHLERSSDPYPFAPMSVALDGSSTDVFVLIRQSVTDLQSERCSTSICSSTWLPRTRFHLLLGVAQCDDGRLIEDYWIFVHRGTVRAFDPIASCFVQIFVKTG